MFLKQFLFRRFYRPKIDIFCRDTGYGDRFDSGKFFNNYILRIEQNVGMGRFQCFGSRIFFYLV